MTNFFHLSLLNISLLLILSVGLNFFIFIFINIGIFGKKIKFFFIELLENNINLIPLFCFLAFLILTVFFSFNILYLDSPDVVLTATIDNIKVEISGEAVKTIFDNIGSAGVFAAGGRIAAGLISKNLSALPKAGVIGGAAAGFTITYKILQQSVGGNSAGTISVSAKPLHIKLETLSHLDSKNSLDILLNKGLDLNPETFNYFRIIETNKAGTRYISSSNNLESSKIIQALNDSQPN
jgi:hypothetical protein